MNVILLEVRGQLFGLEAERVVQVVEPPQVTEVPFLPNYVEGLVNIGGRVMVSIDLAAALGDGGAPPGGVGVVVRTSQGEFVLHVGRVLMMVPVGENELHPVSAAHDGDDPGLGCVSGEFLWQDRMVLMLDPDRFDLGAVDVETGKGAADLLALGGQGEVEAARGNSSSRSLPWLVVELSGERYALDVKRITEVFESASFLPVPKAPREVLGYLSLRGAPLLVVSLAVLLGVAESPVRHVVVIDTQAGPIGLGVCRVDGIRAFDAGAAEDVADASGAVAGCLVEANGSMIAVLDFDHVLTAEQLDALAEFMPKTETAGAGANASSSALRRLLTFWLGDELCGIDLDSVSRVAEFQGCSELPDDGAMRLSGVTQIGNEVMPMIDLRERRGLHAKGPPAAQVVAKADGGAFALAVDRMHRIIDVPEDDIRAVDDPQGGIVSAVGRADGRLVSVLAVDHLVEGRAAVC